MNRTINQAFSVCKESFVSSLNSSTTVSAGSQMLRIRRKVVYEIHIKKLLHRNHLKIILPEDEALLYDDDGADSGCSYSHVPIFEALVLMLCDPETRKYC